MIYDSIVVAIISFIVTVVATKFFIRYSYKTRLLGKDIHKEGNQLIPSSGGLPVFAGILISISCYILYTQQVEISSTLFSILLTLLIITTIGVLDDFAKDHGGLKQWQKPLFCFAAAVPMMVLKLGNSTFVLPFFDIRFDIGIAYPLLLIPIGLVGCSNMVNMLAGYNGLEAGMGLVYTFTLSLFALVRGQTLAALFGFSVFGALLGFFIYNKFPSRIFPGDSLTYLLGAFIGIMAIIGNMEKAALAAAIPFFLEFMFKARTKFKGKSFSTLIGSGKLMHTGRIESLPHLFTKSGKYTEKQITQIFMGIEFLFCLLIWVI